MARLAANPSWMQQATGHGQWIAWRVFNTASTSNPPPLLEPAPVIPLFRPEAVSETAEFSQEFDRLKERLVWRYEHGARHPRASQGISLSLRRRLEEAEEETQTLVALPQEAPTLDSGNQGPVRRGDWRGPPPISPVSISRSLPWKSSFAAGREATGPRKISPRRRSRGTRSPRHCGFFQDGLGRRIRNHASAVKRELEFTARFTTAELAEIGLLPRGGGAKEFLVIQGVADLVAVLPDALWLVDFKTDQIKPAEIPGGCWNIPNKCASMRAPWSAFGGAP